MTTMPPPICIGCTHIHVDPANPKGKIPIPWSCDAFPKGIPDDILMSRVDHRQPVDGDQGITFEPMEPKDAEYADFLFNLGKEREQQQRELQQRALQAKQPATPVHADPSAAVAAGASDPQAVVMIVEIGHAFDSYGFVVVLEDGTLEFNGINAVTAQRMRNIVTNMRVEGQTDAQVLADLPRRLDNYLWAVDRTHETEGERAARLELERKQTEQRLAIEAEAAQKRAARAAAAAQQTQTQVQQQGEGKGKT